MRCRVGGGNDAAAMRVGRRNDRAAMVVSVLCRVVEELASGRSLRFIPT